MKRTSEAISSSAQTGLPDRPPESHAVEREEQDGGYGQQGKNPGFPAGRPPRMSVRHVRDVGNTLYPDCPPLHVETRLMPLLPPHADHPNQKARTRLPSQDPLLVGDRYREDLVLADFSGLVAAPHLRPLTVPGRRMVDQCRLPLRQAATIPSPLSLSLPLPLPLQVSPPFTLPLNCCVKVGEAMLAMKTPAGSAWHMPRSPGESRILGRLALVSRDFQQATAVVGRRTGVERFSCEQRLRELAAEIDVGTVAANDIMGRVREICDGFDSLRLSFADHIGSYTTQRIRTVLKKHALKFLLGIFNSPNWTSLELIYEGNAPVYYRFNDDTIATAAIDYECATAYRQDCHDVTFLSTLADCMAARASPGGVSLALNLFHHKADCDFFPKLSTLTRLRALAVTGYLGPLAWQGLVDSVAGMAADDAGLQDLEFTGPAISCPPLNLVLAALGSRHRLRRLNISSVGRWATDPELLQQILASATLQALTLDAFPGSTQSMLRALRQNRNLRSADFDLTPIGTNRELLFQYLAALLNCAGLHTLKIGLPDFDRELGQQFAAAVAKNVPWRLLQLNLARDNAGGLYPLFDALKYNTGLRQLHLPRTGLSRHGVLRLVDILSERRFPLHLVIGAIKGNRKDVEAAMAEFEELVDARSDISVSFTGLS